MWFSMSLWWSDWAGTMCSVCWGGGTRVLFGRGVKQARTATDLRYYTLGIEQESNKLVLTFFWYIFLIQHYDALYSNLTLCQKAEF